MLSIKKKLLHICIFKKNRGQLLRHFDLTEVLSIVRSYLQTCHVSDAVTLIIMPIIYQEICMLFINKSYFYSYFS